MKDPGNTKATEPRMSAIPGCGKQSQSHDKPPTIEDEHLQSTPTPKTSLEDCCCSETSEPPSGFTRDHQREIPHNSSQKKPKSGKESTAPDMKHLGAAAFGPTVAGTEENHVGVAEAISSEMCGLTKQPAADEESMFAIGKDLAVPHHDVPDNSLEHHATVPQQDQAILKLTMGRDRLIVKRVQGSLTEEEKRELQRLERLVRRAENSIDAENETGTDSESDSNSDSDANSDSDSEFQPEDDSDNESDSSASLPLDETSTDNLDIKRASEDEPATGTCIATSKPRARPKRAKNCREFIARLHKAEDERQAQQLLKRKHEDGSKGPRKARKVAKTSKSTSAGEVTRRKGAELIASLSDVGPGVSDDVGPMPVLSATTHKAQLSQLLENLPEGYDTRRVKSQGKDLKEARKIFGYKKVKAVGNRCKLKPMKTPLEPFQLTAVAWMVKRELGRAAPFGGLLADTMGTGKTVMCLACITGNPPDGADRKAYCKATLVVVQNASTAFQWQDMIQEHCGDSMADSVLVYKPDGLVRDRQYANRKVVIATYKDLAKLLPSSNIITRLKKQTHGDTEALEMEVEKKLSGILKINWYRVILDEAHAIKNRSSRTTMACWHLKAKNCWAVTGTPLANSANEFYPYLKFIGCKFTWDYAIYKKNYIGDRDAQQNFEALSSLIMYRRRTDDKFLGRRIVDLPGYTDQDLWISLSEEESVIYAALTEYYDRVVASIMKNGKVGDNTDKSAAEVVSKMMQTRFMRLRQAISHPFNLEMLLRQKMEKVDISRIAACFSSPDRIPLRRQIRKTEKYANGLSKYSTGLDMLEKWTQPVFGGRLDMASLMRLVIKEHGIRNVKCPKCQTSPPEIATRAKNCIVDTLEASQKKRQEESLKCLQKKCNQQLLIGTPVRSLSSVQDEILRKGRFEEPGRDSLKTRLPRKPEQNTFYGAAHHNTKGVDLPPSGKLTAAMAVILTWLNEAPDDKIIVFTQFVMTGKVLGRMLQLAEIPFLYYFGCNSSVHKIKALRAFKEDPEKKIMLASLGSGAESLNLAVANRVINIDPWWNKTREAQAFARVHRYGQKKICHLVRIFAENTIDERIRELQDGKAVEIDWALQDDGHIPVTLSAERLEALFTPPEEDEED